MGKEMLFDHEAREALRRGFNQLADLVRITLGPRGRHVMLNRGTGLVFTNDGFAIASEIAVADPFENMGVRLGREIGVRTLQGSGGGATTATVLAQSILEEGLGAVRSGADPLAVKQGMDVAAQHALRLLSDYRFQLDADLACRRLAASLRQPEGFTGRLVELLRDSGAEFCIEAGSGAELEFEVSPGLKVPAGYLSPYFVTSPETMEAVFEHARIVLTEGRVESIEDLARLMEATAGGGEPLVVFCKGMDPDALATLVVQNLQHGAPVAALGLPESPSECREVLRDLSRLTGARIVDASARSPLRLDPAGLGRAERIVAGREGTVVQIGERPAAITQELNSLRTSLDDSPAAETAGRVVRLRVPSGSGEAADPILAWEAELASVRTALADGVVAGGGTALVRVADALEALDLGSGAGAGVQAVLSGLTAPLRQIAENSGHSGETVLSAVRNSTGTTGFNAASENVENLAEAGIVDPVGCLRAALVNAVSMAGLVLTTQTLVADTEDPPEEAA